jgi:DHA2 family multidrug resistance protein
MSSADATADRPSAFRQAMILYFLTLAVALYAMTITIANVSLPQMQGSLSATQDQIAWIVTFNIVATAVATPLTGWLAARFGRRRVMLVSLFGFTVTTLLCGLANSLGELVFYRVLQGLCGAPLAPLANAIVLDTFPRERHGTVSAIFGMGVVLGPIMAPTVGGYLSEALSWRWVFFMVVPFGVVCFFGVWACIENRYQASRISLDWTGFVTLALAIGCLQLVLDRGERNDWFDSAEIVIEVAVALGAFYLFVVHSLTHDKPFLDPQLLKDRCFSVGLFITILFGMLNFTPMVLLPPMLQTLKGYPDSIIGLLLGARGAGTMLGFFVMFFGNRLDPRIWLTLGFSLQAVAGYAMAQFDINVTTFDVAWTSALQGLGVGFIWVPLTLVTTATLNPRLLPVGMSIFHLLRNIGSSVHISLSVALVIHMSRVNYAGLTENISPYNESLRYGWVTGFWNLESLLGLIAVGREIQRQAAMIGYINAFYFYTLTALAVLPLIVLVGRAPQAARKL